MLQRPVESAQYVSIRYTDRLVDAGIEPSVGSVGDSYDNEAPRDFRRGVVRKPLILGNTDKRSRTAGSAVG
jgi:transposase InsO family protein